MGLEVVNVTGVHTDVERGIFSNALSHVASLEEWKIPLNNLCGQPKKKGGAANGIAFSLGKSLVASAVSDTHCSRRQTAPHLLYAQIFVFKQGHV